MKGDRHHTVMVTFSFWLWSCEFKHTFTFRTNQSGNALWNEICGRTSRKIATMYPNAPRCTKNEFAILNFSDLGY